MNSSLQDSTGPSIAGFPLVRIGTLFAIMMLVKLLSIQVEWTESLIRVRADAKTYAAVEQTTSQREMSYLKAGWAKQALTVKPPYVSV
jgi:hypothetical protein